MKIRLILSVLVLSLSTSLYAQEEESVTIEDLYIDFAPSSITAFSLLGLEDSEVTTPGSAKEFLATALNYIDKEGNLKPGLAIEWSPFRSVNKKYANWNGNVQYALKSISISAATTTIEEGASQAGIGLKWNILDLSDPLNNKSFHEDLDQLLDKVADLSTDRDSYVQKVSNEIIDEAARTLIEYDDDLPFDEYDLLDEVFTIGKPEAAQKLKETLNDDGLELNGFNFRNYYTTKLKSVLNDLSEDNLTDQEKEVVLDLMKSYINQEVELTLYRLSFPSQQLVYQKELKKLKEEFQKNNWNKLAFQVSGGFGFQSDSSFVGDYQNLNSAFDASLALPFDFMSPFKLIFKESKFVSDASRFLTKNTRLVVQAKQTLYNQDFVEANSIFSFGGKLVIGGDNYRVSMETAKLKETNTETDFNNDAMRYTLGFQFKFAEKFWQEIAIMGVTENDLASLKAYPRFSFKRAFNTEVRK